MGVTWLTILKASLAIAIVSLVLARIRPLPMIAVIAPFAMMEAVYVYRRWSLDWDDGILFVALLVAIGQLSWFGGAMLVKR